MTASDDRHLRLNAAIDGELDAMSELAFEREIAADPALAAERATLEALCKAIRRHAPREAAPKALADRIAGLAGAAPNASVELKAPESARAPALGRTPHLRPAKWAGVRRLALPASFAALGFAVGVGMTTLGMRGASPGVAAGLVSDYSRAAIAGQPYDVASSDRHTVKPWLASRTTVSASIVDLASQGFPLTGGRVTVVDKIPVPTLVYRHNEHLIAVTELPLEAHGARADGTIETVDGYHVARWSDASLDYVAVTDMDERTLAEFVAAFRTAGAGEEATHKG